MRPAHRTATFMALTAAAALSITGCGADSSLESPDPQVPAASAPAAIVPAATSSPMPTGPMTFTFPDGRLSFQYPEGWRVEVFEASASPFVATATVYDPAGQARVSIYTGEIADVVAGSASRTVIETDPVPGLVGHSVPTPHSSFFVDRSEGSADYRMGLTAGLPVSPLGEVQNGLVMLGDRILTVDVLLTGLQFGDDDAAKAWYWGVEGQALKGLLMSFSYR